MKKQSIKPEYGNWVSKWIPIMGGIVTVLLTAGSVSAFGLAGRTNWIGLLCSGLAVITCIFTVYMTAARGVLSYDGGGIQGKVLDGVLDYLEELRWSGEGKLIDIGCGSGAMSIKAAKRYSKATITGIDYWGKGWDYSKKLCEDNARIEGVTRIEFRKGNAAKLDFDDNTFDAAISNFVFHEVRTQPDKLALICEALRVIKPGGYFVFEDVFYAKGHYGDIRTFVKSLEPYVSELYFVDMRHPDYAPAFLNTPLILGQMGLIYGRK